MLRIYCKVLWYIAIRHPPHIVFKCRLHKIPSIVHPKDNFWSVSYISLMFFLSFSLLLHLLYPRTNVRVLRENVSLMLFWYLFTIFFFLSLSFLFDIIPVVFIFYKCKTFYFFSSFWTKKKQNYKTNRQSPRPFCSSTFVGCCNPPLIKAQLSPPPITQHNFLLYIRYVVVQCVSRKKDKKKTRKRRFFSDTSFYFTEFLFILLLSSRARALKKRKKKLEIEGEESGRTRRWKESREEENGYIQRERERERGRELNKARSRCVVACSDVCLNWLPSGHRHGRKGTKTYPTSFSFFFSLFF